VLDWTFLPSSLKSREFIRFRVAMKTGL
jgi:hypothetical protein